MIRVQVVGDGEIQADNPVYGPQRLLQGLNALETMGLQVEARFDPPAAASLQPDAGIDVLWLLGHSDRDASAWQARHAEVVARMGQGVGVLASGDHDRRGLSLCGHLPQVRALRHWRPPLAPTHGVGSINTLAPVGRPDHPAAKPIFCHRLHPVHPLLRHPAGGAIRWLPDHAHEGELDTAALAPEVSADLQGWDVQTVAWTLAWENGTARLVRPSGVLKAAQPPAGSTAGRIVVDSSFHHWVHGDVTQLEGEALAHWQVVLANIVVWLLPAARRTALRDEVIQRLLRASPISQLLQLPPSPTRKTHVHATLQGMCERAPLLAALLAEAAPGSDALGVMERLADDWS